jgi:hypothetical protein
MHNPSSVLTSLIGLGLTTVDLPPFRIGQPLSGANGPEGGFSTQHLHGNERVGSAAVVAEKQEKN